MQFSTDNAANAGDSFFRTLFPEHRMGLAELLEDSDLCSRWTNHIDLLSQEASYDELRGTLHAAQAMEGQLRQLLTTTSAAVARLNDRFTDVVNGRKFNSLPDDVLGIILEMTCQGLGFENINKLMLVSRRFRQVVLTLPSIWSYIEFFGGSRWYTVEKAKVLASRATAPTINLNIHGAMKADDDEIAACTVMYELAASISSRIRDLFLFLGEHDFDKITNILSSASFPVLVKLELRASPRIGRSGRDLFRDWDMPSLRDLAVTDVLPVLRPDAVSRVETLSIQANRYKTAEENGEHWGTTEIVTFILSLSSLKRLHVAARFLDDYHWRETSSYQVSNSSVERLSLDLHDFEVATSLNVLHIIQFTAVTSFKLRLGLPGLENLKEVLPVAIGSFGQPEPRSLKNVTLSLCKDLKAFPVGFRTIHDAIGDWTSRFGELKSLTLESRRVDGLGLFSFAQEIDSLRLIRPEGSDTPVQAPWYGIARGWHRSSIDKVRRVVLDVDDEPCMNLKDVANISRITYSADDY